MITCQGNAQYLLGGGLLRDQADEDGDDEGDESHDAVVVEEVDSRYDSGPRIFFAAPGLGVYDIENHADDAHRGPGHEPPERALYVRW